MALDRNRGYGYKEVLKDTFVDSEGTVYKIYRRRWRTNFYAGQSRWRDYIQVAIDKDGNEIPDKTKNVANVDKAKTQVRQESADNALYTQEEYQAKALADKEAKRLDLKAHEAVAQAKQSAADITARQTEIAQKQTARVSGEAIRQQRDALLAQGYNPEEARMMTAQGSENVARTVADLGQQGQALHAQTVGQISQFGAEQGWTAENLSQGIKQMQQDLMKHREGLANQLQIAKIGAKAQKDAASSAAWGSLWGGLGEAAGGYYSQKRLGGEIKRLGGKVEED
jgi:hypothetical protein